jgi:AcrR family transcriptional regulator
MERHPTEQKILDEAIRIIEANGEAGLRVHDIEVAVEVTPPSIYHFFGSREGLVSAAQAERLVRSFAEFNALSESILRGVSSRAELRDAFLNILTMIYDPSRSLARQQRLFALGSVEGRPELAVVLGEAARGFLRQLSERLQVFKDIGWRDRFLVASTSRSDVNLRQIRRGTQYRSTPSCLLRLVRSQIDGAGRTECFPLAAHTLCNHVICNIGPEFAEPIMRNAWEKVMNGVMIMPTDQPT